MTHESPTTSTRFADDSRGSPLPWARWPPGAFANLLLVLPATLLLGLLFLVPLGRLVALSIEAPDLSLGQYTALFESPLYPQVLIRTLRVSLFVVLGCLLFGYPIAYLLVEARPRIRQIVALLVLLPFWTSILVRNYAWVYLLQRKGAVNELLVSSGLISDPLPLMFNEMGVVIGMSNALLPFMVLPIYVAIQSQDRAYLEAAAEPRGNAFALVLCGNSALEPAGGLRRLSVRVRDGARLLRHARPPGRRPRARRRDLHHAGGGAASQLAAGLGSVNRAAGGRAADHRRLHAGHVCGRISGMGDAGA